MIRPLLFVLCVAANAAAEPPGYRFEVGQELHYTGVQKHWYRDKPEERTFEWRLYVTQANADGSWEVMLDTDAEEDKRILSRITVFPDGRIPWNAALEALPAWLSVRRIMPMLPTDAEAANGQWTCIEPRTHLRWDYQGIRDGHALSMTAKCRGPMETVSVGSIQFSWTFDLEKRAIVRYEEQGTWEDYNERDEESLALSEVIRHDAQSTAAFRSETQRYFETLAAYNSRFSPHDWAARVRSLAKSGIDAQLQQARQLLASAESACAHPIVREQLQRLIKRHDESAEWIKPSLEEYQKIVDQDSPAWAADDLEGQSYSLEKCRGNVVVLDFWFRKCNYCIRANPQFEAVIERFKDKPVQFFGMNTDEDIADAKFAVTQLKPSCPTLRGKAVQEQYGISGCPTWLILDKQGVVRAIHVGYSGRLEEELTASIAKLLD